MKKQVKKNDRECKRYSPTAEFTPNFCGSLEGIAKITYRFIPNFILGQDCNCHDYAYFYGGCKAIDDTFRYKADKEFYINMKARVDTLPWYRRYYYRGIIWTYYKFVRKFGHNSFNWFDTPFQWSSHLIKNGYDCSFLDHLITFDKTDERVK